MKIEENNYKGFVVIFTEDSKGWIKDQVKSLSSNKLIDVNKSLDLEIQRKIKKSILAHETIKYINKLEETHPEMRNSVASLYMPRAK